MAERTTEGNPHDLTKASGWSGGCRRGPVICRGLLAQESGLSHGQPCARSCRVDSLPDDPRVVNLSLQGLYQVVKDREKLQIQVCIYIVLVSHIHGLMHAD